MELYEFLKVIAFLCNSATYNDWRGQASVARCQRQLVSCFEAKGGYTANQVTKPQVLAACVKERVPSE